MSRAKGDTDSASPIAALLLHRGDDFLCRSKDQQIGIASVSDDDMLGGGGTNGACLTT